MSFASEVREELCEDFPDRHCCLVAECYGILLYCNTFTGNEIRIVTENRPFAMRLPRLFRRALGVEFDQLPSILQPGKCTFVLCDPEKLAAVFSAFGLERNALAVHINFGILEDACCRRSFFRGAFLSGGSVTDPDKRYHLELVTGHLKINDEARSLLQELELEPKDTRRGGSSVLYIKQSDRIVDFLSMIGAQLSAMKILQAKVEKSMRNRVNRRVNCDTANLTKAVDAAQEQLSAIRLLRQQGQLDTLPPKILEAAILRESHPEATLSELAAMTNPPVSKPAFSHRMRSLVARSRSEDPSQA